MLVERLDNLDVDTWRLFDDTRECIDEAHRDDSLKSVVKADLETYVERDPLLAKTLHKLRSSGKKLFLLTNSYWEYTKTVMSFLLDGELPEYSNWQSYFEVIVTGSKKPGFFTGNEPLAELDDDGNILGRAGKHPQRRSFQGGNLRDLEKLLGMGGEVILYVGDHIYGDILRTKKSALWRTALVVEELEDEIQVSLQKKAEVEELAEYENKRRELDDLANSQRRRLSLLEKEHGTGAANNEAVALRAERNQTKRQLKKVLHQMNRLETHLDAAFNPNWGMVFKEGNENSRFGEQVAEYACIYTSRVSNFLHYSAYQYFRSRRDLMPHERDYLRSNDT
ncbi:MAG: 5'-nucleotidase domain-containing protein [Myxococcota bacterium]